MTGFWPPIHPGQMLKKLYLRPLGMSACDLAERLDMPSSCIECIINKAMPITPETAQRLATFFQTSPDYWLNMQASHDLNIASTLGMPSQALH